MDNPDRSPVTELLSQARRRSITHLVIDQTALALTIGMGGVILLLLTGTQILDWYWVVLLTVVSLGVGIWRFWNTIPTTYRLAQRIDRRLNLADALSTASYFASPDAHAADNDGDEAVRVRQRQEADDVARSIDVRAGVPFNRSRFMWPAVALFAVAFGLFAVRYAVTGTMSLQPSLVRIALDTFFPSKPLQAKNKKQNRPGAPNIDDGQPDTPTTQQDEQPDNVLQPEQTQEEGNADSVDQSKSASKTGAQSPNDTDQQNADKSDKEGKGDKGDKQSSGDDKNSNDSKDGKGQQGKDGKDGKQGQESSSMLDKLKDAMANMMNKMKSSTKDGQQQQQSQNGDQKGNENKDSKGQPSQSQNESKQSSQSDQQSDGSDKSQSADARGQEKSSDKNASPDSKSGIGSADGDKSAKDAEELKAMGKISEILGKRSANVSGEVMVEVGSSKQQLKTPFAQRQASHVEAGSEIHRDEVPLADQQFVQQYFEQIRKPAAAKAAPAKDKPQPDKNPGQ